MQTVVVNIYKEQFDVYIGRAGRGQDGYFGNPFRIGCGMSREDAVQSFLRIPTQIDTHSVCKSTLVPIEVGTCSDANRHPI